MDSSLLYTIFIYFVKYFCTISQKRLEYGYKWTRKYSRLKTA